MNEHLDHFPVGRRIAFDARRGRLWVVCTTCARWNLSPLDERWEVIESCERLYRDTPKRLSTDQVGLAKLADGMILVRIGDPVFPEYASWRYGRLFTRREAYSAYSAQAGGIAVLATLFLLGGPLGMLTGLGMGAFTSYHAGRLAIRGLTGLRGLGEVELASGEIRRLSVGRARRARVVDLPGGGWTLAVPSYNGGGWRDTVSDTITEEEFYDARGLPGRETTLDLLAPATAEMIARRVMPVVNASGGDDEMVRGASKLHEQWEGRIGETVAKITTFQKRPMALAGEPHLSLAFEMSVYEDQERRWLQTELYLLKAAWQEAERLAAIADNLTIPEWVDAQLGKMKEERT